MSIISAILSRRLVINSSRWPGLVKCTNSFPEFVIILIRDSDITISKCLWGGAVWTTIGYQGRRVQCGSNGCCLIRANFLVGLISGQQSSIGPWIWQRTRIKLDVYFGDVNKKSKMAPTLRDAIHFPFLAHFYVQKFPCPSKTIEACCRTIGSVRKYEVCVTYACNSVVKHLRFDVFQFRPAYLHDETPHILKNKVRKNTIQS